MRGIIMSNSKKWLVVLLSVLVTVLCGVALAACNSNSVWRNPKNAISGMYDPNNPNNDKPFYFDEGTDPDQFVDDENAYILTITSMGGLPLENVKVTVKRAGMEMASARSDNSGKIKLSIPAGNYDISYDEMPAGYFVDEENTVIQLDVKNKKVTSRLSSAVIDKALPAGHIYSAGEVMYNFEYTDYEGETVELKELLKEYKCVLLNFFYTTCGPCIAEFPAIARTSDALRNEVTVVSLDPEPEDTAIDVQNFKEAGYLEGPTGNQINKSFNFFMAKENEGLYSHFGTGGIYPTNILIDRYGVIAFIDTGSRTADTFWADLFGRLTADDYVQDSGLIDESHGNDGENAPLVKPPVDMHQPDDAAMSAAALDASMLTGGSNEYSSLPLHFYGPSTQNGNSEDDIANTWPYQIGADDDGQYIYPGNVGTDNTHAILYTDITLETDQILSLEYRLKIDSPDCLYIVLDNTLNQDLILTGSTDNQWVELVLFTATHPININLNFIFTKDLVGTAPNEFVGIRNIKVSNIDTNTDKPLDILSEMAAYDSNTETFTYQNNYLGNDGYYHMGDSENPKPEDPLIYVNVYEETLWSEMHLKNYTFVYDGTNLPKTAYNFSFYHYNDGIDQGFVNIEFDPDETIIDAYYIQRYAGYYTPVTEETCNVLKAFTKKISEDHSSDYVGGFDPDNTWLELCFYYRVFGEGHDSAEHECKATQVSAVLGLTVSFAIPVESRTDVTFTATNDKSTDRNQAIGGLYYKFTAPESGVYRFVCSEITPANMADPIIFVWDSADSAYGNPGSNGWLAKFEGAFSEKDNVVVYVEQDQTIYLQLSETLPMDGRSNISYKVNINKYKDRDYIRRQAATDGPGGWTTAEDENGNLINVTYHVPYIEQQDNGTIYYYHDIGDNTPGSPIYINFTDINMFDENGHSIKEMLDNGNFDVSGSEYENGKDFTSELQSYYNKSIEGKQPNDTLYGLLLADNKLVNLLTDYLLISYDNEADYQSGAWTFFAVYFNYYGPGNWVDPD